MSVAGSRVAVYKLHPFAGVMDDTASDSTAFIIDGADIKMTMDSSKSRRYVHSLQTEIRTPLCVSSNRAVSQHACCKLPLRLTPTWRACRSNNPGLPSGIVSDSLAKNLQLLCWEVPCCLRLQVWLSCSSCPPKLEGLGNSL